MKRKDNSRFIDPKVKISLPNLLFIPFLSIVFSIIKLCGGVSWNWAAVLVFAPMLTYIGWSIGFVAIVMFSIIACRILNKNSDKDI